MAPFLSRFRARAWAFVTTVILAFCWKVAMHSLNTSLILHTFGKLRSLYSLYTREVICRERDCPVNQRWSPTCLNKRTSDLALSNDEDYDHGHQTATASYAPNSNVEYGVCDGDLEARRRHSALSTSVKALNQPPYDDANMREEVVNASVTSLCSAVLFLAFHFGSGWARSRLKHNRNTGRFARSWKSAGAGAGPSCLSLEWEAEWASLTWL
ncbi:hypothetical protein J6590_037672 [Homalodisca vitripennis]|nr:hypothetical protein J6590_037672 [Homalodisca vitripennis]